MRSPLAAMEGLILRGTDGGERGRKGRGEGIPPKVNVSGWG